MNELAKLDIYKILIAYLKLSKFIMDTVLRFFGNLLFS